MSRIQEFDFSVDLLKFIFWQYDDPKDANISQLVRDKQAAIDTLHTDFWNDWFTNVFNIDTINNFGVSVWAFILDLPLVLDTPVPIDKIGWGFGEFHKNFNHGNFNINQSGAGALTLIQKRIALKMRYRKLTTRGTISEANQILKDFFGNIGLVFMRDNLDMSVTYVFDFEIPAWIDFLANDLDVFPTPQGVKFDLEEP